MKAVVVTGPGEIGYIDVEKPAAGPKDVLAKVRYCGICGTDAAIFSGKTSLVRDGLIKYPVRIGHEWSGVIEEVGAEVKGLKPGDRVVGDDGVACGNCIPCLEGNYGSCEDSRSVGTVNCWDGAFAEYMLMPFRHVFKIPQNIPLDEAALVEPAGIAMNALRQSGAKPGSKVLITGTGAIGLSAVGLARCMGATKIILSGRNDLKLETGKTMGADITVNITGQNLKDIVRQQTGGKGMDIVIEASGNIAVIDQILDIVRPGGTIALIGFFETDLDGFDIDRVILNGIAVKGIAGTPNVMPSVIGLMETKRLNLRPLITHKYPFNEMINVMRNFNENKDMRIKALIEVNGQ